MILCSAFDCANPATVEEWSEIAGETFYWCPEHRHKFSWETRTRKQGGVTVQRNYSDAVQSPAHYTVGGIETIDYLCAKLSPEEFAGFCRGNVLKYVSRAPHKAGVEDLRKAAWYLERLIAQMEEEQ